MSRRAVPFWDRVDTSGGPSACWPWRGARSVVGGYGVISIWFPDERWQRQYKAHRVAFEYEFGTIPAGLMVCHRCDNPPCCNPAHLFVGTAADNIADRDAKGRTARIGGERHSQARLSVEDVRAIRRRPQDTGRALAREFGVCPSMITKIRQWRAWPEVKP